MIWRGSGVMQGVRPSFTNKLETLIERFLGVSIHKGGTVVIYR